MHKNLCFATKKIEMKLAMIRVGVSHISSQLLSPREQCSPLIGRTHLPIPLTNKPPHNVVRHISTVKRVKHIKASQRSKLERQDKEMVMWVFGYGSLIWKAGFPFDESLVCFIKHYRRVFHQGSTDHRGTPEYPGRTVTIEPAQGEVCWGVAYKISKKEDQEIALTYLEVREKQYDKKAYLDVFTELTATTPAISRVMVYIASPDKKVNTNYLGPASVEEIARQIIRAEGPSGPNRDYLFQLEKALLQIGCLDKHVMDLADEVRRILSEHK